jgi:hypothetical protein
LTPLHRHRIAGRNQHGAQEERDEMSVDPVFAATQDDYRPSARSLSNGEVRATGTLAGGAVMNIARELILMRHDFAKSQQQLSDAQTALEKMREERDEFAAKCGLSLQGTQVVSKLIEERNDWREQARKAIKERDRAKELLGWLLMRFKSAVRAKSRDADEVIRACDAFLTPEKESHDN